MLSSLNFEFVGCSIAKVRFVLEFCDAFSQIWSRISAIQLFLSFLKAAQNAQKDSLELFQTLYFLEKDARNETSLADAIIFQIRANGLLVFVPRLNW